MAKVKGQGILWDTLNRGTAKLYRFVARSFIGRVMTGYRRADAAFAKGKRYTGRHTCAPMSPARLRLLTAVESGILFKVVRAVFGSLFGLPMALYGMFLLTYGLMGTAINLVLSYVESPLAPGRMHLIISALMMLLALPLTATKKTLAELLGEGGIPHLIFVRFLGIPKERLDIPLRKTPAALPFIFAVLAMGSAVGALFSHVLLIPLILIGVGVLGLVFAYPEAGVILSTAMLPLIWLDRSFLIPGDSVTYKEECALLTVFFERVAN